MQTSPETGKQLADMARSNHHACERVGDLLRDIQETASRKTCRKKIVDSLLQKDGISIHSGNDTPPEEPTRAD